MRRDARLTDVNSNALCPTTLAILTSPASSKSRSHAPGTLSRSGAARRRGNRRAQRVVRHTQRAGAKHITVYSRRPSTVGSSWRGRRMLFSVEVRCGAEDLADVMSRMRQWLDTERFEPDVFRHTIEGESVTI